MASVLLSVTGQQTKLITLVKYVSMYLHINCQMR